MFFRVLLVALTIFLSSAENAHALQVHPAPEGLYAHQMAHVFYILSMVLFIYWIHKTDLGKQTAWRYVQLGCAFLALWNIWAFVGHVIDHNLSRDIFLGEGWNRIMMADEWTTGYLYVILKMDHFICVPAVALLFVALRKLNREKGQEKA